MTTPTKVKCMDCNNLTDIDKKAYPGPFILKCKAFPQKIPSQIISWQNPHTSVRNDQVGNFIFTKIRKRETGRSG